MNFQQMARMRRNTRNQDIAESEQLLLELVTLEPTVQQCFKIIEATCLSQGIFCKVEGSEPPERFQRFVDEHYSGFCRAAIRAMFTYGFVPWRVRRLLSSGLGDEVPEVLPPGTFNWFTEPSTSTFSHERKRGREPQDQDTRLVVYRVRPTAPGVSEEDVMIYVTTPPPLDVSQNSNIHATVPSPMSHILADYKSMREAQIRRSHADAWNTTARIISTFKLNLRIEVNPSQYLMDFVHEGYYQPPDVGNRLFPPFQAHNVWQREQVIKRQFMSAPTNHFPEMFALPRDHDVVQQPMLSPCEDLSFLLDKYRRDVSAVLGVPHEMIGGRDSGGGGGHETVRKTMASGRVFNTNMLDVCRHLCSLMRDVYCRIYSKGADSVEFTLVPMPRMEIETVQDIKALYECGVLTPDMSVKISSILLGADAPPQRRSASKPPGAEDDDDGWGGENEEDGELMPYQRPDRSKDGKPGKRANRDGDHGKRQSGGGAGRKPPGGRKPPRPSPF